jgi:hypothetical protein
MVLRMQVPCAPNGRLSLSILEAPARAVDKAPRPEVCVRVVHNRRYFPSLMTYAESVNLRTYGGRVAFAPCNAWDANGPVPEIRAIGVWKAG